MRILLAESDSRSASDLRTALDTGGHHVSRARDAADAWETFQTEPFPLVIATGPDGRQLCRDIRESFLAAYTYLILIGDPDDARERQEGLKAGADDVLPRNISEEELLAHLEAAARVLQMQQELRQRSALLERQNQEQGESIYWLESANHRFAELFAGLPAACYSYDEQGRIFEWNRAAEEMFGYAPEDACHRLIWQLFSEDDPTKQADNVCRHKAAIQQVLAGESLIGFELEARHRDGSPLILLSNTIPVRAADGKITGIISANLDITARRRLEEQVSSQLRRMTELNAELARQKDELANANARLAEIATTDGLTGLKNHRFLQETLHSCYSFARRHKIPMSVLMLDVDQFKSYNDTYGHPAGDEVLRTISTLLQDCVRDHDTVARYGGEEFVVLLPATTADAASLVAERLRSTVEAYPWAMRSMTASFGISTYTPGMPGTPASHTSLLDEADRALYRSKQQGRNRITLGTDLAIPEPQLIASFV
jgi:two-component system cell cycle response regulator